LFRERIAVTIVVIKESEAKFKELNEQLARIKENYEDTKGKMDGVKPYTDDQKKTFNRITQTLKNIANTISTG